MRPPAETGDVYRAIADPTRRAMIDLLRERECSAAELCSPFPISRAAASQHLGVLLESGLVTVRAEGRHRIYALQPDALNTILDWITQHAGARADADHR